MLGWNRLLCEMMMMIFLILRKKVEIQNFQKLKTSSNDEWNIFLYSKNIVSIFFLKRDHLKNFHIPIIIIFLKFISLSPLHLMMMIIIKWWHRKKNIHSFLFPFVMSMFFFMILIIFHNLVTILNSNDDSLFNFISFFLFFFN